MLQRLRSLFARETRSSGRLDDATTALLLGGWGPTASGETVTAETAFRSSVVACGTRVTAEALQSIPVHLFERQDDGGRRRADDHPLYPLIADAPNGWQPASEFRLTMETNRVLHGNAYGFVNRDGDGKVMEIICLDPRSVAVETDQATMEPKYIVTASGGGRREYSRRDMIHIRGIGTRPNVGASLIEQCREAIGLSLVMEKHAAGLFGRGARPGGILKTKGKLTTEIIERLRVSFDNAMRGGENAGKTAILEEGFDFTANQLSSVDAQFLELRKFQVAEVARVLRIPMHLVNDLERATFNNTEQMGQQFITYCLLPILRSWCDALKITLLTAEERKRFYFEFELNDLARADLAARFTAYSQAINAGILNPNEIRAMENRAPYPGGETYMRPVNTAPAPTPGNKPTVVANAA
jgi:HK97 family phage portal protein